jgi:hypothetical protein
MGAGSYMVAKLHRYIGGPGKWKGDHGLLTTGLRARGGKSFSLNLNLRSTRFPFQRVGRGGTRPYQAWLNADLNSYPRKGVTVYSIGAARMNLWWLRVLPFSLKQFALPCPPENHDLDRSIRKRPR